jgi:metallo-beta-lactamase family protein
MLDSSPKIVLSSSGFLLKGRSCEYLQHYIGNQNDMIISVGYAPETSVMGRIKNGEPVIKINRKNYEVKCKCMMLTSFSSHIPRHELMSYLKSIYTDKYILVHSQEQSKIEFKEDLEVELSKMCRTSQVVASVKDSVSRL